MLACNGKDDSVPKKENIQSGQTHNVPRETKNTNEIIKYDFEIISKINKDTSAYTQGLFFHNNILYESTGQRGESSLRKVDPSSGMVLKYKDITDKYFGEGISYLNEKLYYLTWTSRFCYVFDIETFDVINTFEYFSEGWGLTNDGTNLIMSDGSHFIRFIDPETFQIINTVGVYNGSNAISYLNELEFDNGTIWANVYGSDLIVNFDAYSGNLLGVADLTKLREYENDNPQAEVLNGIAINPNNGDFYVTGKYWQHYFNIKLTPIQ